MEAATPSRAPSVFETTEPERAIDHVAALYGPHGLQLAHGRGMRMRMSGLEMGRLHVGELRYGTPVTGRMVRTQPFWFFGTLRAGGLRRSSDGASFGPGEAGVISPDAVQNLLISADAELVNLRVNVVDMEDACRSLLGADLFEPLRFADRAAADSRQAAVLLRLIDRVANAPVYLHERAARLEGSLREALLYELLLAWPNNYAHHLDRPVALPATTRRACEFIQAHAAEAPSVAEIASACGVGVRALSRGFEEHLQTSPLAYMLRYRLDKAREELLGSRDSGSVTTAAFNWGFLQLSSFAARYRERFGEAPSETLRRGHR